MYGEISRSSILGKSQFVMAVQYVYGFSIAICWLLTQLFSKRLARELHCDERREDGTYNLTGMTGSLRFMAPGEYYCLFVSVGESLSVFKRKNQL